MRPGFCALIASATQHAETFCNLLPEKALGHFLGLSTDRVAQMSGDAVLQAAYLRARTRVRGGKPLSHAAINEAANALSQLYLDLDTCGIEHNGINILPGGINDHLGRFVHSQAARKKDAPPDRLANSHSSAARLARARQEYLPC